MRTVIAIDGPAASGKSSVARELAPRLGFGYVNSGAFYRTMTWWVIQRGLDPLVPETVTAALEKTDVTSGFTDGEASFHIGYEAAQPDLHADRVNQNVSPVSRIPAVREIVTRHLRSLAGDCDIVMEGRDIGSVVFPDTPYKFYIDASPEVREQRRSAQGQTDKIAVRDRLDSSRPIAPLVIAEDAFVIDSTHLTVDGVIGEVIEQLKLKGLPARSR